MNDMPQINVSVFVLKYLYEVIQNLVADPISLYLIKFDIWYALFGKICFTNL